VAVIYTRGMVKKMKKMTRHWHLGDSDSIGSGVNPEESSFFKSGIYFFFYRG